MHLNETDSTSNYLTRLCKERTVGELTVVSAGYQSVGKGQRGNSWESERGKNLLFSFVLYPSFLQARRQFLLSQLISLSVKEALEAYAVGFSIKWPNDIYWEDKKICGILIENDLCGNTLKQSIAGIGINVNQETFVSEAPNPVSLKQITGKEFSIPSLLADIMRRVTSYYKMLKEGRTEEIASLYHDSLFRKDGYHLYRDAGGEFRARILRVEPMGAFILEDTDGMERSYQFKEVQFLLEAGSTTQR